MITTKSLILIFVLFIVIVFISFRFNSHQISSYFLDLNDFDLEGLMPSNDMPSSFPFIEEKLNTEKEKKMIIHLSPEHSRIIHFFKEDSAWYSEEEFQEAEFLIKAKYIIQPKEITTVLFDSQTMVLHEVQIRENNTRTIYSFINKSIKYSIDLDLKKIPLQADAIKIESLTILDGQYKLKETKEDKVKSEKLFCYKRKSYSSFLIFYYDLPYLIKEKCT